MPVSSQTRVSAKAKSSKGRQRRALSGKGSTPDDLIVTSKPLLPCVFLATISFAVYVGCLWNGFINYDDPDYVTENLRVQAGLSWQTLRWAFTTFAAGNWHPLTWISHALDVQLFGLAATGHHLSSVILHALNVVLLFLLLRKATGWEMRSIIVAAMFAVHPLNVECVAWVAERKSLLSTLFFLLAIGAYGWFARRPSVHRYGVLTLLFACGLMAKPMVVTLPCVLMLLDFWPLQRFSSSTSSVGPAVFTQRPSLYLLLEKLPLLALSAASAVITILAQLRANAVMTVAQTSIIARIDNALCSYALYLFKAIWSSNLGVFYPPWSPRAWQALLALLFLCAVSLWAWRERRSKPYLLIGWLWYLGTLVPVIGLVQVGLQSMADRYAYIPLIGIFVMLVWLAADLTATLAHPRRFQVSAVAVILLALAAITVRQVASWHDPVSLWGHTSQVTKDNFIAEDNLAMALTDLGRDDEAITHFENAIRILPAEPKADIGIAFLLRQRDPQRSIAYSQAALRLTRDPKDLLAIYTNLGAAYRQLGDYAASANSFQEVLKIDPSNGVAMVGAGSALLLQATARLARNLESEPSVEGFTQLGNLYSQAGNAERAKQAYLSAESLRRKLPAAPR